MPGREDRIVDRGAAVLPYLRLQNTLRVQVKLTQTLPGGVVIRRIQHLYLHECSGEAGRVLSPPGTTDPDFAEAAEFRRVAL